MPAGHQDPIRAVPEHAHVKFPLADPAVRNVILARQMTEAADVVGTSQIQLDFVRMFRLRSDPLSVPEGSGVSVDGVSSRGGRAACTAILKFLAVYIRYREVGLRDQGVAGHSQSAACPTIRGELTGETTHAEAYCRGQNEC